MSDPYTPKAGDEIYNLHGEIGLYVSRAKGGGHIVQPLFEDGDGVTEPESHYADGVAIWPRVYKEPPQPMLDKAIAEQQARLAALLHDAPEYVVGDMISPFKAVIGASYKSVEKRLQYEELLWVYLKMHPRDVDRLTVAEFDRACDTAERMNEGG